MSHVIGVDVGSQSIKGVLLDASGTVVATGASHLTMLHPCSGWAEQDPESWITATADVVGQLLAQCPGASVAVLGLACQVDGVVPLDATGRALRPGIIWLDRRASAQADHLVEAVGSDRLFEVTGLNADASHTAPKMMWLRDEEPDVWRATRVLAPVAAFLLAALTGEVAQDAANASSTMLFDLATGEFSDELCAAAGIDPGLLPRILPSTHVAGTVTAEAARRFGLPPGCAVIVGTGDEHGASFAAGALRPGVVVDVTGTAEPVTAAADAPVIDASRLVETHGHAVPGGFLVENPGFVSGGSTLWLATNVLGIAQAEVFGVAAGAPAGAAGVRFLPTLSGSTSPRWNDRMLGSFAGLSMNHDRSHLARAVLEGCAFALRDIVDVLDGLGLAGPEVRVVGGGARSPLWMQIKADVLGRPVRSVLSDEATAHGAAMLAAVAGGLFRNCEEAVEQGVSLAPHPVEPDAAAVTLYADAYQEYRRLFDGVEEALA